MCVCVCVCACVCVCVCVCVIRSAKNLGMDLNKPVWKKGLYLSGKGFTVLQFCIMMSYKIAHDNMHDRK